MTLDASTRQTIRTHLSEKAKARWEQDKRREAALRLEQHREGNQWTAENRASHYRAECERLRSELGAVRRELFNLRRTATARGRQADKTLAELRDVKRELRQERSRANKLERRVRVLLGVGRRA